MPFSVSPDQTLSQKNKNPHLQRRLTLPLVVLYGLGVTIGAGIYVLVGLTAAKAGFYAPISFLIAAFVISFTAFSYAELSTRYPVSAGEAAYIRGSFKSNAISSLIGFLVIASGIVSSATVTIGSSAYLQHFILAPSWLIILGVIAIIGLISIWGILESVIMASILTLIEVGGLLFVIFYALNNSPDLLSNSTRLLPPFEIQAWTHIASAGLLAFFAFVGFEDMANIAEEVKNPRRIMPKAIILTLVIATLIYLLVVSAVVLSVPMEKLVTSSAPLALVFENADRRLLSLFTLIAILATLNGLLIQFIMASRVVYGLSQAGSLPSIFAVIHPRTHTPINASLLIIAIVMVLALFTPIAALAELTSQIVLLVFMGVNAALLHLKFFNHLAPHDIYKVPIWVPLIGLISSLLLFLSGLL